MNLEAGSIDAIAVDIGVAQYQISSRGDMFRQLDTPISTEQYAIGFKKGNTELCDQVQNTPVSYTHLDVYKRQTGVRPMT